MRRFILKVMLFLLPLCLEARDFKKDIGVGIILGEPTGITIKKWLSASMALDGAIAWSFGNESALHLHADYLFHKRLSIKGRNDGLLLYYGLGGKIKFQKENRIGMRIPLGLAYDFQNEPLDIFLELVPGLDLFPSTDFAFIAALGIRYFF